MAFRERVELGALEIEHADAAILQHQRDRQLRPRIVHQLDVAGIERHVGHVHRHLVEGGIADDAVAQLHAGNGDLVAVSHGDLHFQIARTFVDEKDAEGAVVDEAARQVRDAREELVQVEDRAELAADLGQRFQRAGVFARVLEQTRVFDRHRDVRPELAQEHLVDFGELPLRFAQKVEGADDAALATQRHDELGVRPRHRLHVSRIDMYIVDEDRLSLGNRGADEALPHLDAERPDDFVRIADRIRDRQLLAARIEQVHRKRLELGDSRDELRDLVEQLVEVEHGRDLATQLEERNHQLPDVGSRSRRRGRRFGQDGCLTSEV